MTCDCGANTHLGYPNNDSVDGDNPDEYCCDEAYIYYNSPRSGQCPYSREINNSHSSCMCTPARRYQCRMNI